MGKLGIRLNLLNTGLSQISGMEIDSVCKTSSSYAIGGSEGLGTIGGDKDNTRDIDWKLITLKNNYNIPHGKRVRKLYINGTSTDDIKVTCEESTASSFNATTSGLKSEYSATATVNGQRSYHGPYWEFTVESVNNCKAFINYIGVLFVVLTRRRGL